MAPTYRGAALVASLAVLAATTLVVKPALAASAVTKRFLANAVPNVDFLDRSSRFALTNSKSKRLKAFAFATAREQTLAANAIYDWTLADANPKIPLATSKGLDTAATGSTPPAPPAPQAAMTDAALPKDERLPLGQEDLDSLEGLEGTDFDAQYKDKQADALAQVETDYRDYVAVGDDPALKALAARELPKVTRRRVALGKL